MSLRTVLPRRAPVLAPWAMTLLFASFVALAQPKPALVKDANEPGLNPYVEAVQLEQNTTTCQPASPPFSSCSFVLSTVSAGKRRVITYASVSYFLSPGGTFPEVFLGSTGGGYVQLPLQPVQSGTLADRQVVSTPVTFYIEPGESPRFTLRGFDILDSRTATLTLSGYYVNLP
jgi:hypothetical protein